VSSSGAVFPRGTFTPDPGIGSRARMLAVHARTETVLALRHSEQLLLTLVIPVALLVGLTLLQGLIDLPAPRVNAALGTVLALAMMSTGFTSQAIALGFDRRYGLMRRLAATAIPRWLVIAGRLGGTAAVVVVQVVVLGAIALLLGWRPEAAEVGWALVLVVLGAAAFGACGLLLGGAVRADLVLVIANLVWFVLLFVGGIVVPAGALPGPLGAVVVLLPSGALAEGLRTVLVGGVPSVSQVVVLLVWTVVAGFAAARTLRWD
jgi:ABC-2 type transport system permease protein